MSQSKPIRITNMNDRPVPPDAVYWDTTDAAYVRQTNSEGVQVGNPTSLRQGSNYYVTIPSEGLYNHLYIRHVRIHTYKSWQPREYTTRVVWEDEADDALRHLRARPSKAEADADRPAQADVKEEPCWDVKAELVDVKEEPSGGRPAQPSIKQEVKEEKADADRKLQDAAAQAGSKRRRSDT